MKKPTTITPESVSEYREFIEQRPTSAGVGDDRSGYRGGARSSAGLSSLRTLGRAPRLSKRHGDASGDDGCWHV